MTVSGKTQFRDIILTSAMRFYFSFMKFLAIIFVLNLLVLSGFSQTSKPKQAVAKPKPTSTVAKPKPTSTVKKTDSKTKPSPGKQKTAATNPKSANTKSKTANPKSKPKNVSKKSDTKTKTVAVKPKIAVSKPRPEATPTVSPEETADWAAALVIDDGMERVSALRLFVKTYPVSEKKSEATSLIVTIQSDLGNDLLTSGDVSGAVTLYKAAAEDAPKPIPDQLFTDTFSKFPANLFFRGARSEAFEIARIVENKADTSVNQLLSIASFYMSVENGSQARRLAGAAIKLDSGSSAAYQAFGLANRMDFLFDDSVSAYSKALELDPESIAARRGLAEMYRATGKASEAVALYREILEKDAENLPAETGLVLALFDSGNQADAETELAKVLEINPGNIILLSGTAYWYAANNDGEKAVNFAQRAIAVDPRFIWSHIALARGFILQKNPVAAEKTLLAARRYGNFPTLEYEIASARAAAGFYREAAEELAKSFSVKDGVVRTKLGGRVERESKDFTELIGFERRASIFAPTAADSPESAAKMTALMELMKELEETSIRPEIARKAVDDFVRGDDKMKVHRQLFAGSQLLEKRVALDKVVELTKAATHSLDAGLDVADTVAAVMASELYETRTIAAARGEYVNVPDVPKSTLSSILRGRLEDINGWAYYQMDDAEQAVVHLKRAVSVLPPDSSWWQTTTWRLGIALILAGKEAEALEAYIRTYKSGKADELRYNTIEALYRRVIGHTLGLEERIGPHPNPPNVVKTVARSTDSIPFAQSRIFPTPIQIPVAIPIAKPVETVIIEPAPTPTPTPTLEEIVPTATPETVVEKIPEPTPVATPTETPVTRATASPAPTETDPVENVPTSTPESSPTPTPTPTPDAIPAETTEAPEKTDKKTEEKTEEKPLELIAEVKPGNQPKDLFPPVVISIPTPQSGKSVEKKDVAPPKIAAVEESKSVEQTASSAIPEQTSESKETVEKPVERRINSEGRPRIVDGVPASPPEITPCKITVSEETVSLQNGGGDLAIIVGRSDDLDLDGLTAVSTSPQDVSIRREIITGVSSRALFVVRSVSSKSGLYQVKFELPCGKKELMVRVR